MTDVQRPPLLVLVGGPPGVGKTTLAREIATRISCPMVSRDEIKEGLVHGSGYSPPGWGSPIAPKAYEVFFRVLRLLLDDGCSVVAEAAFIGQLAAEEIRPLLALCNCRIIECRTATEVAVERFRRRMTDPVRQLAHADDEVLHAMTSQTFNWESYEVPDLGLPVLAVDTTHGYEPGIDSILDFLTGQ